MAAVMVVPLVVQMASMACYSVVSKAAAMVVLRAATMALQSAHTKAQMWGTMAISLAQKLVRLIRTFLERREIVYRSRVVAHCFLLIPDQLPIGDKEETASSTPGLPRRSVRCCGRNDGARDRAACV